MSRDDTELQRNHAASTARVWRVGEQRSVVGGCLQAAFAPVASSSQDADIERLMRAIGGVDRAGGQR